MSDPHFCPAALRKLCLLLCLSNAFSLFLDCPVQLLGLHKFAFPSQDCCPEPPNPCFRRVSAAMSRAVDLDMSSVAEATSMDKHLHKQGILAAPDSIVCSAKQGEPHVPVDTSSLFLQPDICISSAAFKPSACVEKCMLKAQPVPVSWGSVRTCCFVRIVTSSIGLHNSGFKQWFCIFNICF